MNHSDKYKLIFFHLAKCAGKSVAKAIEMDIHHSDHVKADMQQSILLGFDLWQWNKDINFSFQNKSRWDIYTKFTIVRNPWDRVVSLYHFRKKENDLYKLFPPAFGMNILGGDVRGPDGKEWDFKRWILSSFVKGLTIDERASFSDEYLYTHKVLEYDSKTLEEAIEHHRFFTEKDNYIELCSSEEPKEVMVPGGSIETVYGYKHQVRDRIEWFNQIDIISGMYGEKLVDYVLRFEYLEEMWNKMFKELGYKPPKLSKKNISKHKHYSEYYDDETREFIGNLFKKDIEKFGYEFERI